MPFKSEAQRRYLWANEPEIARDWTDTYGSRIQKNDGGIMRLGFYMGGASPDEGHENDPGHGANAPSDDHSYKTHHPNIHGGMKTQNVVTPANVFTDVTKDFLNPQKDYFNQTWSGQPNFLGFGGGYRNLKTPNDAGSGYQSRLNPMGLMSLLGGYMKKPFSLAATGINAVRNKFGPAFNNFTSSKTLEQFRDKMRGYGRTMPTYSPYLKFGGIETLGQEMPEETNIDNSMWGADQDIFGIENARGLFRPHQMSTDFNIKYGPEGITYYEDELPEEDVITGTNYPNETETILDKAKRINKAMQDSIDKTDLDEMELKINRARWNRNPPWPAM